jgi:hypothetical protein
MRRLANTLVGLSAAAVFAAFTGAGIEAQAEPKKQPPPAAEKKQPPAAEKKQAAGKHVMITATDVKWGPNPPGLPAGAEVAVLDGDPAKAGMFTMRVKVPDGYLVQPHWHPTDEHLTVLSGNLMMATGSKWDDAALHDMTAGSYSKMPRRVNHFVKVKGETIFQVSAMGPFAITYVNPNDDPRKKSN